MKYTVTLIPGDGIGPEVTGATTEILEAAGAPLNGKSSLQEWPHIARVVMRYQKPLPVQFAKIAWD